MATLPKESAKYDLYLRIDQSVSTCFEVGVEAFFTEHAGRQSTVSVESTQHLPWEGRKIKEDEYLALKRGIEVINVNSVPRNVKSPNGASYLLEIDAPGRFARYEWWGSLPEVWSSLKPLIDALQALAIEKQ